MIAAVHLCVLNEHIVTRVCKYMFYCHLTTQEM